MLRQSSNGNLRNIDRIPALSSVDWMGPVLRRGPRRRWKSRRKAAAKSGGKAKSKDEAAPPLDAMEMLQAKMKASFVRNFAIPSTVTDDHVSPIKTAFKA